MEINTKILDTDDNLILQLLSSINALATDHKNNVPAIILTKEARKVKEICEEYVKALEWKTYNK